MIFFKLFKYCKCLSEKTRIPVETGIIFKIGAKSNFIVQFKISLPI